MRNRCNVLDHLDFQTNRLQSTDGCFSASTRSLYINFYALESVFHSSLCSGFCCGLCCERSRLSGASEAESARACPADCITLCIGNGNDGVVECRLDVYCAVFDVLPFSPASDPSFPSAVPKRPLLTSSYLRWSLPDPCVFLHWSLSADHEPADPSDDERLCSNRFQPDA